MAQQRAVIFDLETVPDLDAGRELLKLDPHTSAPDVRRLLGEKYAKSGQDPNTAFVKVVLQKIVCIGAIFVERDDGPWTVQRSGVGHIGVRTERELVDGFVESLNQTPSPQLVGFNSSGFDLPVLRYRAFALSVSAPTLHGRNGRDYWYRYGRDHIDLCDVMANFGASPRPSLAELSALCGIPSKMGGIDGSQVEEMILAGRVEDVAAYCETDVLVTYLIFLRFSLLTGNIDRDCYLASIEQLRRHIEDKLQKRPHLQPYLHALELLAPSASTPMDTKSPSPLLPDTVDVPSGNPAS